MDIEKALEKCFGFDSKIFREKAIEGGYKKQNLYCENFDMYESTGSFCEGLLLLDRLAWKAVGITEGWGKAKCKKCGQTVTLERGKGFVCGCATLQDAENHKYLPTWQEQMNSFISALQKNI